MSEEKSRNIRLGIFVLAGTLLLVLTLYFIGSRQNLFGSTFKIRVRFNNVNGLMQGNNVRFAGIDVGTVSSVKIENDTTVLVELVIEDRVQQFIKKNAIASVGTDGLMGNKLVNINASALPSVPVNDGDIITSLRPLEMDEMVRTLGSTNDNILVVTENLRKITHNISNRNSFWHLLSDTNMASDVRNSVSDLRQSSRNTAEFTGDLKMVSGHIKAGKGMGAVLYDSVTPARLKNASINLQVMSDSAKHLSGTLTSMINEVNSGKGSLGKLVRDSSLILNINRSVISLDSAATNLDRNLDALQYSWPFKKGFRKMK